MKSLMTDMIGAKHSEVILNRFLVFQTNDINPMKINILFNPSISDKPMLSSVPLRTWVVIVPSRDANAVERLVSSMQRVGRPLRFNISNPTEV